jgi:ABC-type spermidine/putrescine transport system permease subunit II
MPGIVAGSMLVFIPAIGEYVIPALLGGPDTLMIGRVLWDEFFSAAATGRWPRRWRSSCSFWWSRRSCGCNRSRTGGRADGARLVPASGGAVLGFVFLYAPIVSLVVFSFNESRLVTVWGGFSTRWYGELLRDRQILNAAWISLQVAFARPLWPPSSARSAPSC